MSAKLDYFYSHEPWTTVRKIAIESRRNSTGDVVSDYDGQPISPKDVIIVHHVVELTDDNVDDASISLNLDNLRVMTLRQHNMVHERFKNEQSVLVLFGCNDADIENYIHRVRMDGDIVVSVSRLYDALGGGYDSRLTSVVLNMHRSTIDLVANRYGDWKRAFVVGWYGSRYERERLCKRLGADSAMLVFGDTLRDPSTLAQEEIDVYYLHCTEGRNAEECKRVDKWFNAMGWKHG